jgi:hypothetical protein
LQAGGRGFDPHQLHPLQLADHMARRALCDERVVRSNLQVFDNCIWVPVVTGRRTVATAIKRKRVVALYG